MSVWVPRGLRRYCRAATRPEYGRRRHILNDRRYEIWIVALATLFCGAYLAAQFEQLPDCHFYVTLEPYTEFLEEAIRNLMKEFHKTSAIRVGLDLI